VSLGSYFDGLRLNIATGAVVVFDRLLIGLVMTRWTHVGPWLHTLALV
jgi:hypothetical protein